MHDLADDTRPPKRMSAKFALDALYRGLRRPQGRAALPDESAHPQVAAGARKNLAVQPPPDRPGGIL